MLKLSLAAAALAAATLVPTVAAATTISFTYDGVGEDTPDVVSHGNGSISFSGTGTLTLADVTGFQFAQTTTINDPSLTGSGTFSYGITDLTSFAGTFANGAFAALSLATRPVMDPTGYLDDQAFAVDYRSTSTNSLSASTLFDDGDTATQGTIGLAAAAVPEPAGWAMMILGMGVVGAALRRRQAVGVRVRFAQGR